MIKVRFNIPMTDHNTHYAMKVNTRIDYFIIAGHRGRQGAAGVASTARAAAAGALAATVG